MNGLFSRIDEELPKITGWCSELKAKIMAAAVLALRPTVTVEIGVWGGKSLIPMAMAHKDIGFGTVIGIDPWSASASIQGQASQADKRWWSDQNNHDMVYGMFMDNIKRLELDSVVQIIKLSSNDVDPPPVIDIWHCDGNHGPQAIADVEKFAPNIRVGGLAFMDDTNWTGGSVSKAIEKLLGMGFIDLYKLETGNVFQRVK